jgi:hypothetical protein
MFGAHGLIFGGTEGVGSYFHVLRSRTRFRRYRGRRVPFSCFALPDSFSAVPRASGSVFMFCLPGLVFGGTEGVRSRFHVMRSRNQFSTVPSASGPVFIPFAPRHVFSGNEGVRSRFHVLRSLTHFLRYRGRRVPFSCFPLPDSFSAVSWASGPFFMFCAPGLVFGGTEGFWSHFHVLRSQTHFRRYRGRPTSFSAVPRASGLVFMFCAPEIIFGDTYGVGTRFHVLRARFHFRRCRGRRVSFSCFARPDSFSEVPRASIPVFLFCASGLIFGGTEGVGCRFQVLRSRTQFRRYQGLPIPFSCFPLPDMFLGVPRESIPIP